MSESQELAQPNTVEVGETATFRERLKKGSSFNSSRIRDDVIDVQDISSLIDADEETRQAMNEYIGHVNIWRQGKSEFVNDAEAVDHNLKRRTELMMTLSKGSVLDDEALQPIRAYVVADKASIANPDITDKAYENFKLRRETLRKSLNLSSFEISATEYANATTAIQGNIQAEGHIDIQRELIAIRKEVAQENSHNPRFVAEVATREESLFDELLVDLEDEDLRNVDNSATTAFHKHSEIRGEHFTNEVAKRSVLSGKNANGAQKTQAYMRMVEMGKEVGNNPLAIKTFADAQIEKFREDKIREKKLQGYSDTQIEKMNIKGELGGKDYELGIAALQNERYAPEMANELIENAKKLNSPELKKIAKLDNKGAMRKIAKNDPLTMFRLSHATFQKQFEEGLPGVGLSFAAMEHSALQIINDPEKMSELANLDLDAAQAVEQFNPKIRQEVARTQGGESFDEKINATMAERGLLIQKGTKDLQGEVLVEDETNPSDYVKKDIQDVLDPKEAKFQARGDGKGGMILALNEEDFKNGKTYHVEAPTLSKLNEDGETITRRHPLTPDGNTDILENGINVKFNDDGGITLMDPEGSGDSIPISNELITPQKEGMPGPKQAIKENGPHITVLHGGQVFLAATEADAQAKRGVTMSLYGVNVPGKGTMTKDDSMDAGEAAKEHIEELLQRHGGQGLSMEMVDGREGQKELLLRLNNSENLSHRLLRDGYALPSECEKGRNKRKDLGSKADINNRGLWKNGFPEDDGTWRGKSKIPHLSRKDKKENLGRRIKENYASSGDAVKRILSDRGTPLFAMGINSDFTKANFYRGAMDAVRKDPNRIKGIYDRNIEIMKGLDKKLEKEGLLSRKEKIMHDQLNTGSRLIGKALVEHGTQVDPETGKKTWKYISPMQLDKDTSKFLSDRQFAIPESVKQAWNSTLKATDQAAKKGKELGIRGGSTMLSWGSEMVS